MQALYVIFILVGVICLLAIIAVVGLLALKRKDDKIIEEESYYNASTNTYSKKGFMWRLGKTKEKVSVTALEIVYGGVNTSDEEFSKNVEGFTKQIVKVITEQFKINVIGQYGNNNLLIATLRSENHNLEQKMQKIKNDIIAMNTCFDSINVYYGYCVDDVAVTKLVDRAIFTLKYAHIYNTNAVKYDESVAAVQSDFARVSATPEEVFQNEFKLIYQPIVRANDGIVYGAEVKTIWVDGSGSLLYKARDYYVEFIKRRIADKLDIYTLNEACIVLEDLDISFSEKYALFVNIAAINVLNKEFVAAVKDLISRHNFNKNSLIISVLATSGTLDPDTARIIEGNLATLGLRTEIRQFGNNNVIQAVSSASFDLYKLNTLFTQTQLRSKGDMALLGGMIGVIEDLERTVVVEGVETPSVVRFVRNNSEDALLQGDFLFREMSFGKYKALLQNGAKSTEEVFNEKKEQKVEVNKVEVEEDPIIVVEPEGKEETITQPQEVVVQQQEEQEKEVQQEETVIITPKEDEREDKNTITNIIILGISVPFMFNQNQTEYSISVPYNTSSISLSVSYDGFKGKVVGDGQANLNIGNNFVYVYAVSEQGNKGQVYTLAINRLTASNNNNARAIRVNGMLVEGFNSANYQYKVKVPAQSVAINVGVETEDAKAKVSGAGDIFLSGDFTNVPITIFSEDGTPKQYFLVVEREVTQPLMGQMMPYQQQMQQGMPYQQQNIAQGMPYQQMPYQQQMQQGMPYQQQTQQPPQSGLEEKNSITNIELAGDLGDSDFRFNLRKTDYVIIVPYSTQSVTLAIEYDGVAGTIVGNGTRELVVGNNVISAYVISESGKKGKVYTLNITRQYASTNDFLKDLKVNGKTVQGFNKKTLTYKMSVAADVDSVTIEAIAEDEKAQVSGNGQIPLSSGSNIVAVYVTSEFGSSKTYMIVIAKEEAPKEEKQQMVEKKEEPVVVVKEPEPVKEEPKKEEPKPVQEKVVEPEPEDEDDDDAEEDETDVESEEDTEQEESRLEKLMEEFKKQFKSQWEQEMLKKYPEIMKKHNERKLFAERVIKMSPEQKEFYNEIKNNFMSYEGIKNVTKKFSDNFIYNKTLVGKIAVSGKSIKLYLALDPSKYPMGQYPHKDESAKKSHVKTPFATRITSKLALKRAGVLIGDLVQINGMQKSAEYESKDYAKGLNFLIKKK